MKNHLVSSQIFFEDDARTVEQLDLGVELDLLECLGAARNAGDLTGLGPLQAVDDAALADVGVADKADSDCPVGALDFRQLLDELNEVFCADGLG